MVSIAYFVILCTVAVNAATNSSRLTPLDGRILGGQKTNIGKFPWQASLLYNGYHFCNGAVISKRYVLTAASCLNYVVNLQIYVRVGSASNTGGDAIYVSRRIIHPNFARPYHYSNDIALLQLERPSILLCVTAVGLHSLTIPSSASVTVTGWGSTTESGSVVNYLREVTLPYVDNSRCNDLYRAAYRPPTLTSSMLCARPETDGKGLCHGDLGAPGVYGGKLVGIASWGLNCDRPGFPVVFTRVSDYINWISENII